jgi:hypothetical protein
LAELGINSKLPDGSEINFDPKNMVLTVKMKKRAMIFTPRVDKEEHVFWICSGDGIKWRQLPASCRGPKK